MVFYRGIAFAQPTQQTVWRHDYDEELHLLSSGRATCSHRHPRGCLRPAYTNQAGIYAFPLLQPGSYRVEVKAEGFRPVSRTGVQLVVAQTAVLDFALEV